MEHFRVACLFLILFGVCQDSHRYVGATFTSCGGTLTSSTGLVQSPNYPFDYPHNTECEWIIGDSNKHSIELSIESFHLENNCNFDSLEIRNGSNSTSPLVQKYCGAISVPHNIRNLRPLIYMKFKADGSNAYSGFSIRFKIIDHRTYGGNFHSSKGIVNYPAPYPGDSGTTEWTIETPVNHVVVLNVKKFNIEADPECASEYLEIRSDSTIPGQSKNSAATSTLLGKYCGSSIPKKIIGIGNRILLRFKKNNVNSQGSEGFSIEWGTAQSSANCGAVLTSSHGTISSPYYPEMYDSPITCDWNIRVAAGSVIQLLLVHFEFEGTEDCNLDSLKIYDGSNRGGKKLGTYCRSLNRPLYLETTSNVASVRFRSNSAHHGRRFQIVYHTVCHIELHGSTGVIESPNFPYPNQENCSWMIVAPLGNTLSLRFIEFDLQGRVGSSCNNDYLEITEEDDGKPNRQIGKFCNSTGPPSFIMSTQRKVMIHFHSDNSTSRHSFRLEWFATLHNAIQPPSPSCLIWNDPVPKRDDYTYTPGIGGHKLHTEAVPWNEARLTCEEEGGYLAIINSDAELNAITNLFHTNAESFTESQYPNYTSIGFHDFYSDGQFVTIHGQSLARTGFFQWEDGQLDNNERSENCGALSISGELNEVSCENNYAFVCEVPIY